MCYYSIGSANWLWLAYFNRSCLASFKPRTSKKKCFFLRRNTASVIL
nr:hypothetical protein [Fusarium oxysporum]